MGDRGPLAAYRATSAQSPLVADHRLYEAIHQCKKQLVASHLLPIRSGYAWAMKAGQVCRLTLPDGPQVGDLNIWSQANPKERFWASRTRQLQSSHVKRFDRLWSCLPWIRPLVTVTGDSLGERFGDGHGVGEDGSRVHDLLGTRCDPYINQVLSGEAYDYHCHSNLTRAVQPFGLTEMDVHDVLNVFQVTGLNKDGKYYMYAARTGHTPLTPLRKACPAQPGEYWEFFAEMNVICALSTCPGGDLSKFGWGDESQEAMLECCRPIRVEVFDIEDQSVLDSWKPPQPAQYKGNHGIQS